MHITEYQRTWYSKENLSGLIYLLTAVFKQLIHISINNLIYRQSWPLRSEVFLKGRRRHSSGWWGDQECPAPVVPFGVQCTLLSIL